MSDKLKKGDYGPKGAGLYDPSVSVKRKANNAGQVLDAGPNKNAKVYSSGHGGLSAKEQAAKECAAARVKELSGPIKADFSDEEKKKIQAEIEARRAKLGKDELLDEEADGKREVVEGKEPLKKDPAGRWKQLKKTLHHEQAFMNLEEELEPDQEEQPQQGPQGQESPPQEGGEAPPQGGEPASPDDAGETGQEVPGQDDGQEGEADPSAPPAAPAEGQAESGSDEQPPPPPEDVPQDDSKPLEAVSPGGAPEEEPAAGGDGGGLDPQELMDALREEGYSDQEIAYIVHGHHAPEIDLNKQAKAKATGAMSDLDLQNATEMSHIEREHAKRTKDHEHAHSQRMADLEYQGAQKKQNLSDIDEKHRQRMLDLEYTTTQKQKQAELDLVTRKQEVDMQNAQATAPDAESDKASARELKQIEIQKKKLELRLHEEEMKLELEFKKREHELKLRLMEQQMKEQAKQKSEISGIKHEQRVTEAKNPPAEPAKKKSLKKSEGESDE